MRTNWSKIKFWDFFPLLIFTTVVVISWGASLSLDDFKGIIQFLCFSGFSLFMLKALNDVLKIISLQVDIKKLINELPEPGYELTDDEIEKCLKKMSFGDVETWCFATIRKVPLLTEQEVINLHLHVKQMNDLFYMKMKIDYLLFS